MNTLVEKTARGTGSSSQEVVKNILKSFITDLTSIDTLPYTAWKLSGIAGTLYRDDDFYSNAITSIDNWSGDELDFYLSFDSKHVIRIKPSATFSTISYMYFKIQLYRVDINDNVATLSGYTPITERQMMCDINTTKGAIRYGILKNSEVFIMYMGDGTATYGLGVMFCSHDNLYKIISTSSTNGSYTPRSINTVWRAHVSYNDEAYYNTYDSTYTPFFYTFGDSDTPIRFVNRLPFPYSILYQNQLQIAKGKKMTKNSDSTVITTLDTVYDTTKVTPNKVIQIDGKTFYTLDYYTIIDISEST